MPRTRPDPFAPKASPRPAVAYEFLLDELTALEVSTRAMFGSTAVYVGDEVVFLLRNKGDQDDGVWVAFEPARLAEVERALPRLTTISAVPNVRSWRKLAASSAEFEEDVLKACALVRSGGLLGKTPDRQKAKKKAARKAR